MKLLTFIDLDRRDRIINLEQRLLNEADGSQKQYTQLRQTILTLRKKVFKENNYEPVAFYKVYEQRLKGMMLYDQ